MSSATLRKSKTSSSSLQRNLSKLGQPDLGRSTKTAARPSGLRAVTSDGFQKSTEQRAADGVQEHFQQEFGDLAASKGKFHKTMKSVYGEGYDKSTAEGFRKQALAGDFSWMPKVKFLDDKSISSANGAYDANSETVYLNKSLLKDPAKAAQTYMEEAGHHLDTKLKTSDTKGDEGEMFRRVLSGEKLTPKQVAAIRNEDDKGTITVDGKQVEVEFWNPFKAIGKGVKKAAKAVGGAIKKVATGVKDAAVTVGKGIGSAVVGFGKGIGTGVGGFIKNVFKGKFADAGKSLLNGLDKAFLQTPVTLAKKLVDGASHLVGGVANALGPIGKPLKWLAEKGSDFAKTGLDTVSGIVRDVWRLGPETLIGFGSDVFKSIKKFGKGDFKGGFKQFGNSFLNAGKRVVGGAVDVVARAFGGVASIGSSLLGFEKDMTKGALTSDVKDDLRKVYGDTVNFDDVRIKQGGLVSVGAPRTVGNTIYVPKEWGGQANFNKDGTLTDSGKKLIMHEMGHVWQNQNGGGDYIHKSLFDQLKGAVGDGDRGEAYEWENAATKGTPFGELNPEQQASMIETANWILSTGQPLTPNTPLQYFDPESQGNRSLSAVEVDYLRAALENTRRGSGA